MGIHTKSVYQWEDLHHPKLKELRETYKLDQVVRSGATEYERQILLKNWVHNILPRGDPKKLYYDSSSLEILVDAGKRMYCTQYAFTYLQCALALGWQSRKLSIDWDHGKSQIDRHHGIVDVWSKDFNKWYCIDPDNNINFEKEGTPLNSLEVRNEWISDNAVHIQGVAGRGGKNIAYDKNSFGHDTPSNYFWVFISHRNNFFEKSGLFSTKGFLWVDEYSRSKTWYRNDPAVGPVQEHQGYSYHFIQTSNIDDLYPRM